RSDLEVGAKSLEAGIWGAHRNVLINLDGVEDEAFRRDVAAEAAALAARAREKLEAVLTTASEARGRGRKSDEERLPSRLRQQIPSCVLHRPRTRSSTKLSSAWSSSSRFEYGPGM